jgi:hypothetical protein
VLRDVIAAGNKLKAIFKEPTITPTAGQVIPNLEALGPKP